MEKQNGALSGVMYSIFAFILFITFMILKLCNVINWSWWWVTAPLWAGYAIGIAVTVIVLLIYSIYMLIRTARIRKQRQRDKLKAKYLAYRFKKKYGIDINKDGNFD